MDDKTLTALRQSIEKWERNAVAETPDDLAMGVEACPLCALFWRGRCVGCPVMDATDDAFCDGSPYDAAESACEEWFQDPSNTGLRDAARAAARAEVAFLRSLLPDRELDGTAHHPNCECNRCYSNMGDDA